MRRTGAAPAAPRVREAATARRGRLDAELVRRGLASSRGQAQRLIAEGRVTVGGAPATRPSTQVAPADAVAVAGAGPRWASRGGHKLEGALDALSVGVVGRRCLDAGASTGGFTDVLLARGAATVIAVDVGYGQLAWRLRTDDRVTVVDRTNVRHLEPGQVPGPAPSLIVADLSFISLGLALPALVRVGSDGADLVLLVKPQFEVGREAVGRGGVVRHPRAWAAALRNVVESGAGLGLGVAGACASPLPGPAGNVEFFLHLRAGASGDAEAAIARAVTEGLRLGARTR